MTVTASDILTVSRTSSPAFSEPAPLLIPLPEATTDVTVGVVVSITSVPVGFAIAPEVTRALPSASRSVAPPVLNPIT